MYLIVGLGNPEPEYSQTRHNMGFDVINEVAKKLDVSIDKKGYESLYTMAKIGDKKVILLKPQTYMNESGRAIEKIKNYYKIEDDKIIIIYDDIDLPKGTMKLRKVGGAGTHNGMKSVVSVLNTKNFARIRIGIGAPEFKELMIQYVIGKISDEEYELLEPTIKRASDATIDIVKYGIDKAMNLYNLGKEHE